MRILWIAFVLALPQCIRGEGELSAADDAAIKEIFDLGTTDATIQSKSNGLSEKPKDPSNVSLE